MMERAPFGRQSAISGLDFNGNPVGASEAGKNGPVLVTEDGQPAYVLLTMFEDERLTKPECNMAELLSQKDGEMFEFEPPWLEGPFWRPVEFD